MEFDVLTAARRVSASPAVDVRGAFDRSKLFSRTDPDPDAERPDLLSDDPGVDRAPVEPDVAPRLPGSALGARPGVSV